MVLYGKKCIFNIKYTWNFYSTKGDKKLSKELFKKYEDMIKKLLKGGIIGLVLALIAEFAYNGLSLSNFVFSRYVMFIMFFSSVCMGFTYGFKELFNLIIENRVKITLVLFIVATICGLSYMPTNPDNAIFGRVHVFGQNAYEYYSSALNIENKNVKDFIIVLTTNLSYAVLFLVSFEVFKKLADEDLFCYVGALLVTFSSYMLYSFEFAVLFYFVLVMLIDKILNKEIGYKVGLILVTAMILLISATTNLGIVVSMGYIMLGLVIYMIIRSYKAGEDKSFLKAAITCIIIGIVLGIILSIIMHILLVRNGFEFINKFEGKYGLFDEYYNLADVITPYLKEFSETIGGNIISIFPIPFITCFIFMLKNDDKMEEVVPFIITTFILLFWTTLGKIGIISDVFGLSLIGRNECAFGIGLGNVFMLVYALGQIRKKSISLSLSSIIVIISALIYAGYVGNGIFTSRLLFNIVLVLYFLVAVLVLNSYDQKYRKVGAILLILIIMASSICMNPIVKSDYAKFETYIDIK